MASAGCPGGRGTFGAAAVSSLDCTDPSPRNARSHAVLAGPGGNWRPPSRQVSAMMRDAVGSASRRSRHDALPT
eukprot:11195082-Lingulodinium_polyedra.AAC.1